MKQNVIWALFIGEKRDVPPFFITWWQYKPQPQTVFTTILDAMLSPSHMTLERTEQLILNNQYRTEGECYYLKRLIEGEFKDI